MRINSIVNANARPIFRGEEAQVPGNEGGYKLRTGMRVINGKIVRFVHILDKEGFPVSGASTCDGRDPILKLKNTIKRVFNFK